jgi:hypothetical protein
MDETAGEIAQKLRRGNAMYKYADGDADGLGLALLAFHGALADWLDEQLMRDEALDHATREAASTGKLGWLPRADAALRRGLISADQRRLILDANRLRAVFAHGGPFTGSTEQVTAYREMVLLLTTPQAAGRPAVVVGRDGAAVAPRGTTTPLIDGDDPQADRVSRRAAGRDRAASAAARRTTRPAQPRPKIPLTWPVDWSALADIPWRRVAPVAAGGALLLVLALWAVASSIGPAGERRDTARTPTASPVLTTPTPMARLARIVNLGGAVGRLHQQPTFTSPQLVPRLDEGSVVTLAPDAPVRADGTTWQLVRVDGYEGWCPLPNLEVISALEPSPEVTPSAP